MASANGSHAFFEGTEKRIEIDFSGADKDLRKVPLSGWEEVVRLSATQILNRKETSSFTSFLLSESSLIVYPRKAVLKTCGRTTPMASISKIVELAKGVGLESEWLSYSRKNFLAPAEQPVEHQSMETETDLCRRANNNVGDAFVLGPMTGEHWFIYNASHQWTDCERRGDFHVDIMMYGLPKDVQDVFHTTEPEGSRAGAVAMTTASGLGEIAASIDGEVDDYCFEGCGYSCNIHAGDAYAMVHVTPQDSCSYASFETNVFSDMTREIDGEVGAKLDALVGNVLDKFRPQRLTLTIFIDKGAANAVGSAPFSAARKRYMQKNWTTLQFEEDYQAIIANFVQEGAAPAARRKRPPEASAASPPAAKR